MPAQIFFDWVVWLAVQDIAITSLWLIEKANVTLMESNLVLVWMQPLSIASNEKVSRRCLSLEEVVHTCLIKVLSNSTAMMSGSSRSFRSDDNESAHDGRGQGWRWWVLFNLDAICTNLQWLVNVRWFSAAHSFPWLKKLLSRHFGCFAYCFFRMLKLW